MIGGAPGDADTAIAHAGKIGQAQPTRRVFLPKDYVLLGAVQRPPGADAPLQRPTDAGANLGVASSDLIEDGDRTQAGNAPQQRHHLAIPHRSQGIAPTPLTRALLLRGQSRVLLDAISAGGAKPGFG